MPAKYRFELATDQDEPALRDILRRTTMPGDIALSFQREPDFFVAERAGNLASQIMVGRDAESGALAGFGCRSLRELYVDGEVVPAGYLSGLRILPELTRGTLLARGYRFLKDLHRDGRARFYATTILEGNRLPLDLLTSERAGLPVYQSLGRIITYFLPLYGWQRAPRADPAIQAGLDRSTLPAALDCLAAFNRRHLLAPVYRPEHFYAAEESVGLFPGFSLDDFTTYRRDGAVSATLGVWDQGGFKQSVVTGYSGIYRILKPLSAIGASLRLAPKLPPVGGSIRYLYAAFLSHREGAEADLLALFRQAMAEWRDRGYLYLLAGVHERHPLNGPLRRLATARRTSHLFLVYWRDLLDGPLPSDALVPHVELATL